jgi:YVTN family beta-propeller protein
MMKGQFRLLAILSSVLFLVAGIAPAAAAPSGAMPSLIRTIKVPGTPGRYDVVAIDPAARRLYLSDTTSQSLDVLNLTTNSWITQITGLPESTSASGSHSGSNGLAIAADLHKVFVSDQVDNALHVFDTSSLTQTAVIPTTQKGSDAVSYDPVEKKVYVSNGDSNTITVIDATTNTVLHQIALPGGPELSIWDPFDDTIHQNLSSTNQQAVIDPKTDTIRYVFDLPPGCVPHGVGINPKNQHMVIGCSKQMTVTMDGGDGSILSLNRHVGGNDVGDYDPVDNRFVVAASSFKPGPVLGVIDASSDDWVGNAPTDKGAHSLAVDPTTGNIYVAAQTPGTILVFSP